jgi:hypothetical protein
VIHAHVGYIRFAQKAPAAAVGLACRGCEMTGLHFIQIELKEAHCKFFEYRGSPKTHISGPLPDFNFPHRFKRVGFGSNRFFGRTPISDPIDIELVMPVFTAFS